MNRPLSLLPFMLAFIAGVAAMPTNVYQVCAWNVGTLELEPWRQKRAALVAVCRRLHRWFSRLWTPQLLAAAAVLVLLVALAPHADAHTPSMAIVGAAAIVRPKLVAELDEAKKKASKLMTDADAEQRELTAEERTKVQEHLDEAKRVKARIDGIDGDEEMRRQIEALNPNPDMSPIVNRPGATRGRTDRKSVV